MRVLIVAPNVRLPGTNGGATHVAELSAALARTHDVLVIGRHGSGASNVAALRWIDPPFALAGIWPHFSFRTALAHARRFQPDVIYERNSALGLGVMIGQALNRPVVSMILDRHVANRTWRGANAFITTTRSLVPERFHDRVHDVQWGANIERFHPAVDGSQLRDRYGLCDAFVVGYCGGFYPWHGLDVLVDAAARLRATLPQLRMLLVGDGSTRAHIERLIASRGLGDLFRSVGRVPYDDVPRFVAACDVCVAPYDPAHHPDLARDGMFFDPLKVFEYLAAGKAAVTLDSPNIRRLFEHERDLLLVPAGDPASLAAAIGRLANDVGLRERLARAGRVLVESRYSWRAHADHLTTIFEGLTARA